MPTTPLRKRPAYAALAEHHAKIEGRHLRELFAEDPARGERLVAEAAGLYLDYSKNRITGETLGLLFQLAVAIIPELESTAEPALSHDSSTNTLIRRYRALKG